MKTLQRECWVALNVYTDLADAACAALFEAREGPLGPQEYTRFNKLRKQESEALSRYFEARTRLMTALSISLKHSDREMWLAPSAKG